jgi:large repetitive protein
MWNNSASLTTVVGAGADLGVTLKAMPRPATMGQPLTYTLTLRKRSAVDATNVVVNEWTPARSTLVSATPSLGTCTGARPTVCSLGTLAAGSTATITVVVQPTGLGYVTNHATVKSASLDPCRTNNSRTMQVLVRTA